ncbi:hypothetical protein DVH05_022186 [Phytophthora capsici]|nr:hypothetical protein DVH05_022186 [Phytophthora capsici]
MGSKRLTVEAPLEPVQKLFKTIETGCRTFFPESDPRDWVFLKAFPGGEAQPARRIFSLIPPDEDLYDYNRLPAWMIVAIDEGSYIYGYGRGCVHRLLNRTVQDGHRSAQSCTVS